MRVLVVDDDPTARHFLTQILSSFGARVIQVRNGEEALAVLNRDPPDAVVLDLKMPRMNGYDVLRAIRTSTAHRDLPVMCISSSRDRGLIMRLSELGIAGYLLKPLNNGEMVGKLRLFLEHARRAERSEQSVAPDARGTLLIVDPDTGFVTRAHDCLHDRFDIVTFDTARDALVDAQDHDRVPDVVCLGDGLTPHDEAEVIQTLDDTAQRRGRIPPRTFLLTARPAVPQARAALYEGVIQKSARPEDLKAAFARFSRRGF